MRIGLVRAYMLSVSARGCQNLKGLARKCLAIPFLAVSVPVGCLGQTLEHISVRVIDAKTGAPLKGIWLGLSAWRPDGLELPIHSQTDAHGLASFPLPEPTPEIVELHPDFTEIGWCSDLGFPTDRILKNGVVAKLRCDYGTKWSGSLNPGELVVFAHHLSLWERMRVEIPGASPPHSRVVPRRTAECKFADGQTVKAEYSGASTYGFPVFGGTVPYGKIWATGQDEATTFVNAVNLKVGGRDVPAGHYTIFSIPNPDRWVLIISKKTGEWSRPYPGESYDLTRAEMAVTNLPSRVENFTIRFDENGNKCTMHLDWETTRASVDLIEMKQ